MCVVCVSLARATEKSTHRDDELYIESAPFAEILSKCCANFARRIPKNLHRLVTSPCDFPPNSYTILKRLFAFTMQLPPNICTILSTFPRDFPKDFYNFANSMTHLGTFVCIESRRLGFT